MPAKFDDSVLDSILDLGPLTVRRVTKRVADAVVAEVPVNHGRLRDAVDHNLSNPRLGQVGFNDPAAFYWRFVNDGTAYQPGQHFVEKALEANRGALGEEAKRAARELFGG